MSVYEIYYHRFTLWRGAESGIDDRKQIDEIVGLRQLVYETLDRLATSIYSYFNDAPNTQNTQINYDRFHTMLCDDFLSSINSTYDMANAERLSYGQAQKLINLTFKYLTCYEDYLDFAGLFSHCHMVIDSKVLKTLSQSGIRTLLGISGVRATGVSGGGYNGAGWTALTKDDYDHLVVAYRSALDPIMPAGLTYIELEYHMWPTPSRVVVGASCPPICSFHM